MAGRSVSPSSTILLFLCRLLSAQLSCVRHYVKLRRLLCGAGCYPPNVLQPTEAYCTNHAFRLTPSISTSDDVRGLY
jgi:hypothetical protein